MSNIQQVFEIKGFKNQEEYNEHLDNNNLEICSDCEKEVNTDEINTVWINKYNYNIICDECLNNEYGFCVDCDQWKTKTKMHDNYTGIDGLCKNHFNSQYDGEMN